MEAVVQTVAPLTDSIIMVVARLVDDAQGDRRDPSHSDIGFAISKAGLQEGDPTTRGQTVGKAKRVRATLSWAIEHNLAAGQVLVAKLITTVRACGGFRSMSPYYVGDDALREAIDAFRHEGYDLTPEGQLRPLLLDGLTGSQLTDALFAQVRRARQGAHDASLVTGTGKDLLEATAAHILTERVGGYQHKDFPTLLGQAFVALGFATPHDRQEPGERAQRKVDRAMYELARTLNTLRNKEGTGHGRPWLPSVSVDEARIAVELAGIIAEYMLLVHRRQK